MAQCRTAGAHHFCADSTGLDYTSGAVWWLAAVARFGLGKRCVSCPAGGGRLVYRSRWRGRSAHRLATSEPDSLGRAAFVWRGHLSGQSLCRIRPERSGGRRTDHGGDATRFYHDAFTGTGGDIFDRGDIEYRDHRAAAARFGGRGASGKH